MRHPPAVRRVVVKIGSALLAPAGVLDAGRVRLLAGEIAAACPAGVAQVVIVSSGAVASGYAGLGLSKPPKTIVLKQASAAVGQHRLMAAWAGAFARQGREVAQVLLTGDDFDARARFLNARRTLTELLARGITPIINENDSVSFDEIKLGDNDRLSALVAGMLDADLLLILSTVPGLLDARGAVVSAVPHALAARAHVRAETSAVGTGGMATKVEAAALAASWGVPTVIAGGLEDRVVGRVLAGEAIGTHFSPAAARAGGGGPQPARRRWLQGAARARGSVHVDAGAARALVRRGASLLPAGIMRVEGRFMAGSVVSIVDPAGEPIARGVVAYSADELRRIAGKPSAGIAGLLGHAYCDEAVHRDDLVLLKPTSTPEADRA